MTSIPEPRLVIGPVTESCVLDSSRFCAAHEGVHTVDAEHALRVLTAAGMLGEDAVPTLVTIWNRREQPALERERPMPGAVPGQRRADCPVWCVTDHTADDPQDDMILHQGLPDSYGICVCRTDHPREGRLGRLGLYINIEWEIEDWEDAARLALALLDGMHGLDGHDQV